MAADLVVAGETYRRRSPAGVLVLTVLTCFVYWLVWTYKVNDESRRFLHDESIRPWRSLLAMFPGVLLVVPPFIAVFGTARRIRRMQEVAGATERAKPGLAVGCAVATAVTVLFAGGTGFYLQRHLNTVWDVAQAGRAAHNRESPETGDPPNGLMMRD